MAIFILILLISFNRTINRLTKPVSFLAVFSLLSSTLISGFFYFKKIQGRIFKFNPKWPNKTDKRFLFDNQNMDNIIWTFGSGVTIWTLLEVGILYLAANDVLSIIKVTERPIYFLFMIITIHLWRDIHFYFVHRAIHWAPLYRHAHYIHHKNNNP